MKGDSRPQVKLPVIPPHELFSLIYDHGRSDESLIGHTGPEGGDPWTIVQTVRTFRASITHSEQNADNGMSIPDTCLWGGTANVSLAALGGLW